MALVNRNGTWQLDIVLPNGTRLRRSARTKDKRKAKELHDKLKAEAWDAKYLQKPQRFTWEDAADRWISENSHKKSLWHDRKHLRWITPKLAGLYLDDINRSTVESLKQAKLSDGCKPATVNRMLSVVRAILRRAKDDWEILEAIPKVRLLPEPKGRIRYLTRAEANRLITALPPHLSAMSRFALATGLRSANIRMLRWAQVDLRRHIVVISGQDMKSGRSHGIPLNTEAQAVLAAQNGLHETWVFPYKGQPVKEIQRVAWRKACEAAGIEDFRFHDWRHCFASWHVQAGTPLHVLQELGAWETPAMVRRYGHLNPGTLASYAEAITRQEG